MRRMRWVFIGTILFVAGVAPVMASAAVLAPPGHAGANQYVETIPTSAGNAAPPGSVSGSGSSNPGRRSLVGLGQGASTDAQLANRGKAGQAAAALAAATAPRRTSNATAQAATFGSGTNGGSLPGGIAHALTGADNGGLGLLLPLLLGTSLLAALGLAAARLRRQTR